MNLARRLALPAALALAALTGLPAAQAQQLSLSYLGQQILPTGFVPAGAAGSLGGAPVPVGGLSGIDFDRNTQRYVAISDDRSAAGPARFYTLSLDLGLFQRSANPGSAGVGFLAVTALQQPGGGNFGLNQVDPEGLRLNPANGNLWWSNEGQRAAAGFQNPTVREMTPSGAYVRDLPVPVRFQPSGSVAGNQAGDRGVANNLAFESLSFSTDGRTLYTATENALVQDGPAAAVGQPSASRILAFDLSTGTATAEYVYPVSPVALPPAAPGLFATNGLVELLALAPGEFIAVERSFAVGAATPGVGPAGQTTGNTIRLYHVDIRGATDVSALETLVGASYAAATKTLLLDMSDLRHDDGSVVALDNIEGITFGPVLPDGRQTLVLVSDNNFGAAQFTQFVALAISPVPEPAAASLFLMGVGALACKTRRRARTQR
ncbi:esterase-like activity of phytase family protein [Rubrivivax rivuli]|uniref:Esterase-like activity of phytase family protein n=1 Tax=Rubrivivax rivuli TaxID=1862385 RepID=A0A437REA1_9BURK|nr:esterase-like activity of phytase family protein [Rubrivivax rivuli]RVU45073.1 esterase-like activity of phytase family protein [Rubrivivax rivuli]